MGPGGQVETLFWLEKENQMLSEGDQGLMQVRLEGFLEELALGEQEGGDVL